MSNEKSAGGAASKPQWEAPTVSELELTQTAGGSQVSNHDSATDFSNYYISS